MLNDPWPVSAMILNTHLTVGWPPTSREDQSALWIHEQCEASSQDYPQALMEVLQAQLQDEKSLRITNLESLFRRRARGFSGIKRFVARLSACAERLETVKSIDVEVDAFAYAFLCGAKNFDFILPLAPNQKVSVPGFLYDEYQHAWAKTLQQLELFETSGQPLPKAERDLYLGIRKILGRPGARDEFRALATLLVSGPSTGSEISKDLGMPYDLSDRILPSLRRAGAAESREDLGDRFVIPLQAIPCVTFILREIGGIDLLPILEGVHRP